LYRIGSRAARERHDLLLAPRRVGRPVPGLLREQGVERLPVELAQSVLPTRQAAQRLAGALSARHELHQRRFPLRLFRAARLARFLSMHFEEARLDPHQAAQTPLQRDQVLDEELLDDPGRLVELPQVVA
jgi:hypothetical protein